MRIILVSGAIALAGCGGGEGDEGTKRVVAGFYPLAFAAQQIGGPEVEVANLTPPGAEPHDLEVSPQDVQRIRSADLVLLLGHGFQPQLEEAAGDAEEVLLLLDGPGDPHVWLDPVRYAELAERIGAALGRPAAAARFAARLHALDRELRQGLVSCARREIVTSHAAFGYLAARYRLREIAITGVDPEVEPTPRALERVVDQARAAHATTVFFETLVSPRIAETVAREADARTAVLDPIEGIGSQEAARGEDYFTLMRANLAALRRALGCR